MRLSRRAQGNAAKFAEDLQDQWIDFFQEDDELKAVRLLHALSDLAASKYEATAGDVGVIAVKAVQLYDRTGSASKVNKQLRNEYATGGLCGVLGQPLNEFIEGKAVSGITLSALLNARPDSKDGLADLSPTA